MPNAGCRRLRSSPSAVFGQAARRRRRRASSLTTSSVGAPARRSRQTRRRVSRLAAGIDAASMARQCQPPKQRNVACICLPARPVPAAGWAGICAAGRPARRTANPRNKSPATLSLACARRARSVRQPPARRSDKQPTSAKKRQPAHQRAAPGTGQREATALPENRRRAQFQASTLPLARRAASFMSVGARFLPCIMRTRALAAPRSMPAQVTISGPVSSSR